MNLSKNPAICLVKTINNNISEYLKRQWFAQYLIYIKTPTITELLSGLFVAKNYENWQKL